MYSEHLCGSVAERSNCDNLFSSVSMLKDVVEAEESQGIAEGHEFHNNITNKIKSRHPRPVA